jgi:DNA modification methylase
MKVEKFVDGIVILGDSTTQDVWSFVNETIGAVGLIVADPPYGNIVDDEWDQTDLSDELFSSWMIKWTRGWTETCLSDGGAFYVWGGVGIPGFRPFLRYLSEVEQVNKFELANLITWKKRRAYGVQNNYLFTREECAYFVKGDAKKPLMFNVPLLDEKRGYAGFNKKYPAKSEFYRRSNVWTDITEIMQGKRHPTEKKQRVIEVPIEVHTKPGDYVIDPFAGAGTTADACRKLDRRFVIIENNETYFDEIISHLKSNKS